VNLVKRSSGSVLPPYLWHTLERGITFKNHSNWEFTLHRPVATVWIAIKLQDFSMRDEVPLIQEMMNRTPKEFA